MESVEVIETVREPRGETLKGCPEGEVRPIVFYPDERLAEVSAEVTSEMTQVDLDKLVSDLATTMYMCGGMGLSAIQIGVPLRVFVCDITGSQIMKGGSQLLVAINPVITFPDESEMVGQREGCLSFPGVNEAVERPNRVILRARDRHGEPYVLRTDRLQGRVIQHEMDHLDGEVFLDRMKPMARANAEKSVRRFHDGVKNDTIRVAAKPKSVPKAATRKKARKKRKAKRR